MCMFSLWLGCQTPWPIQHFKAKGLLELTGPPKENQVLRGLLASVCVLESPPQILALFCLEQNIKDKTDFLIPRLACLPWEKRLSP